VIFLRTFQVLSQTLDPRNLSNAASDFCASATSIATLQPCLFLLTHQVADSIVGKARETLERAIKLVESNCSRWQGRVVYGDTDSMFIALPEGTSKTQAFQVGREIVEEVSNDNPQPVKLKFEKVIFVFSVRLFVDCDCLFSYVQTSSSFIRSTSRVCCRPKSATSGTHTSRKTRWSRFSTPRASRL